jgi:hypothetical protein
MGVSALDVYGIDWVCERICDEVTLTAIAKEASVATATLLNWINADADRSARAKAARAQMAAVWDDRATEVIQAATNGFELAKARELAQHYRWRASKISPAYNDKVIQDHTSSDGSMTPKETSTAVLDALARKHKE